MLEIAGLLKRKEGKKREKSQRQGGIKLLTCSSGYATRALASLATLSHWAITWARKLVMFAHENRCGAVF